MSSPKQSSSSFRYFLAGLKPLGSLVFLAPIGIIAIVALALWQYGLHPEWLGTASPPGPNIAPEGTNSPDNSLNDQNISGNSAIPTPKAPLSLEENNRDFPLPKSLGLEDPETPIAPRNLSELTPSPDSSNQQNTVPKQKLPQLFQPLLPHVKNPNSLFPSLSTPGNASKPVTVPNLKPIEIAPVQENPLHKAMEQVSSPNSPNSTISPYSAPSGNPAVNSAPSSINRPSQPPINRINQVPTQSQSPQVPMQSTQRPYQAYPSYPNASVTPPKQPTQPGYANPNVYGAPPAPIQPVQPISPNRYGTPQGYNQPTQTPAQNNYGMQPSQLPQSDSFYGR